MAMTDGNKVSAQKVFGYSVNGYGVGDLVAVMNEVPETAVAQLVTVYEESYEVAEGLQLSGEQRQSLYALLAA